MDVLPRGSASSGWIWKVIAQPNSGLSFCTGITSQPSAEIV